MEALRARLSRRAAVNRASHVQDLDAEVVRRFWEELDTDAKLEVLRFDDRSMVQRLHSVMKTLCRSELWSSSWINNVSASSEPPERLKGFQFEAPAETDCLGQTMGPVAFVATEDFVANTQMFADMRDALGSPLLEGRPVLQRRDWATILDKSPSSWQGLQCQALQLVELAIFQAFQVHQDDLRSDRSTERQEALSRSVQEAPARSAPSATPEESTSVGAPPGVSSVKSYGAKRRARKKRTNQAAETADVAEDDIAAEVAETTTGTASEDASRVPSDDSRRNSAGAGWLPKFLRDGTAEWQWVTFQPPWTQNADGAHEKPASTGFRAFVKNTFLEIEPFVESTPHRCGRRALSEPVSVLLSRRNAA